MLNTSPKSMSPVSRCSPFIIEDPVTHLQDRVNPSKGIESPHIYSFPQRDASSHTLKRPGNPLYRHRALSTAESTHCSEFDLDTYLSSAHHSHSVRRPTYIFCSQRRLRLTTTTRGLCVVLPAWPSILYIGHRSQYLRLNDRVELILYYHHYYYLL